MKKIKYLLLTLIGLFIFNSSVCAKSNISISSNSNSIIIGNSVNISVTVSSDSPLAFIEGTVNCSGAGINSSIDLNWDDISNSVKAKSYSLALSPSTVGTITCTLNNARATDMSSSSWQTLTGGTSIQVNPKPVVQQPVTTPKPNVTVIPKSSVNYLSNLSVEGKEISPKFDKETTEYVVELENGTTEINIIATAEHNKASIIGNGIKQVTEGVNNFEIIVTAENGSKRTYKLKVLVKEKDPIVVTVDNKEYTVIRKKEQLPEIGVLYSYSTANINNEEIPVYFGEITGYTLVGLKDSNGIINLFTYDESNNSYKLYQEFKFSRVMLYPIEPDENLIPANYYKTNISINNTVVTCYKNKKNNLVLLYGVNIETNNEDFYMYDSFENTLQIYDETIFNSYNEEINLLTSIIIGLFLIILIIIIVSAFQGSISKSNRKTKSISIFKKKEKQQREIKQKDKENKREAKLLEKELKRKEKEEKRKKKNKSLENTMFDITNINIKKD